MPGFRWTKVPGVLLGAALLGLAGPAPAAERSPWSLSLEELLRIPVAAAAKREQSPGLAPSAVSIVTADEIRLFGWQTLGEVLSSLRGVYSFYDRSYLHLGIRGFGRPGDYNGRVLLLLNGVPTNDGLYDQAALGRDGVIDLGQVERIEFVPGPGSVLYGGNALFAVVNVITRNAAATPSELAGSFGSAGEVSASVRSGRRETSGTDWAVAMTAYRRRGEDLYFPAYENSGVDPTSRGMDRERTTNAELRVDHGGFSGELVAAKRTKLAPGGAYAVDLNDPGNRYIDQTVLLTLRQEYRPSVDWTVNGHAFVGRYQSDGDAIFEGIYELDRGVNEYWGAEASLSGAPAPDHRLTLGLGYRDDWRREFSNPSGTVDAPRTNTAFFVQDDWRIAERLSLVAGVRTDRDDRGHRFTSPRYALVYHDPAGNSVKWIHGRAWRPPNAFETDYRYTALNEPNPALRSERVDSRELVAEKRWLSGQRLAVSFYRNRMVDLITLQTDPSTGIQQHFNVGGVAMKGLEIEFLTRIGPATLRVNGSLQRARTEQGVDIANAPTRLANLLFAWPLRNASLAWETRYVGPRRTDSGDIAQQGEKLGGYSVSALNLGGPLAHTLRWEFRIANVFDKRYVSVVGDEFNSAFPAVMTSPMPTMEQDRRSYRASLRWAF